MTTTDIRTLRHTAQDAAREARHALNPVRKVQVQVEDDPAKEIRHELHVLTASLKGIQGFTQEAQVERLAEATAKATELRAEYTEKVDEYAEKVTEALKAALESVPEVIADAKTSAGAAFDQMEAALSEAKELAETRDFNAHQEEKAARRSASDYDW